mmetsp:Transcript_16706/g.31651  ORF Transcript_16706/g.31651 Transcript_16706/m.31651 type:complete len:197 (-) Transcript_16706:760-1350(-)
MTTTNTSQQQQQHQQQQQQQQQQEHQNFISALEKHAAEMTGDEWHLMASELNWTTEQVKLYALQYLHELSNELHGCRRPFDSSFIRQGDEEEQEGGDDDHEVVQEEFLQQERQQQEEQQPQTETVWSLEEMILFDILLVKYPNENEEQVQEQENEDARRQPYYSRWDKIASMIPNKSAQDCKNRYQEYIREKQRKR